MLSNSRTIGRYDKHIGTSEKKHYIGFIASAISWERVHPDLKIPGLFTHKIVLPTIEGDFRCKIIRSLAHQSEDLEISDELLYSIASLLEGYSTYDLTVLMDTATRILCAEKRRKLTIEDFQKITTDYKPASLKNIQLKES
eukprot:UN25903